MTLMQAVEFGRDFAGVAALALLALAGALLWTGATGVSAGMAAGVAAMAAGGVLAIAFFGLVSAISGLGSGAIGLIGGALIVMAGFAVAQYYGVRGFWVFCAMAAGAGVGAILVWLFERGSAEMTGPGAPLLAAAALAFVVFGALGAVPAAVAGEKQLRMRLADLARPPSWFDCAYATLGGTAEQPGRCPFTPPAVEAAPEWAADRPAPASRDAALSPADRAAIETGAIADPNAPEPTRPPSPGELETPRFDTAALEAASPAGAPEPPAGLETAPGAEEVRRTDSSADQQIGAAPTARAPGELGAGAAPDGAVGRAGRDDETAIGDAAALSPAANLDAPPSAPAAPERTRTSFVCFSALGASAERLCPDETLSERDLEVSWRDAGGETTGAAGVIECFFDPDLALHATVIVNLSGALSAQMPSASEGAGGMRRADAIYQLVTRLAGAARSGARGDADQLFLSLFLAGGSPLRAPWAEQAFGVDRADRLFDIRSPSQTLSLMRYLKTEVEALGPGALRGDLAYAVDLVLKERPEAPFEFGENVILLLTDSVDAPRLDAEAAIKLGETARAAGAPIFVIEIGPDRGAGAIRALAERSGGAHFRAESVDELEALAQTTLRRARSFCAVRVSAPESFFEGGSVELKLRRRLENACVFEQIAVIDCAGLRTTERVLPSEL